jgi:hypothetical protein
LETHLRGYVVEAAAVELSGPEDRLRAAGDELESADRPEHCRDERFSEC